MLADTIACACLAYCKSHGQEVPCWVYAELGLQGGEPAEPLSAMDAATCSAFDQHTPHPDGRTTQWRKRPA